MSDTGWEERMRRIEEAMLVNASLMNRIEQKAEAHEEGIAELRAAQAALISTVEHHEGGMAALISTVGRHEEGIGDLRSSQANMIASMNALFEHMDRFIRGLESNGRNN